MESQLTFESIGSQIIENEKLTGVDVGAANFLPGHWHRFIGNALFYLFEPHSQTRAELEATCRNTGRPGDFRVLDVALSGKGGNRLLFKTQSATSSSLLEPNLNKPGWSFEDYRTFPISVEPVATRTLKDVMDAEGKKEIHIIKLDTEGTELEILQGLDGDRLTSVLAVESEIDLRGDLVGRTNFHDFHQFMSAVGMELYDVRVNRVFAKRSKKGVSFQEKYLGTTPKSASVASRAYQFDVVYFRGTNSLLEQCDPTSIRRLIFCFCVYNYFADALHLLELLEEKGVFSRTAFDELVESVRRLHAINQQQVGPVDQILALTQGQVYSHYTWVPYPA